MRYDPHDIEHIQYYGIIAKEIAGKEDMRGEEGVVAFDLGDFFSY